MSGHLLYLVGEPGIGKSTVIAALTASLEPVDLAPLQGQAPARVAFLGALRETAVIEIGRRRPGGFPGTDALPMAVIGDACAYLSSGLAASETRRLYVEGARLANRRFLDCARDAGWAVTVVHLVGEEAAARNRGARSSQQAGPFVKGRRSASANLMHRLAGDKGDGTGYTLATVEVSTLTTPQEQAARVARVAHHAIA